VLQRSPWETRLHAPSAECGDIMLFGTIAIGKWSYGGSTKNRVGGQAVSTDWTEPASHAGQEKHRPQSGSRESPEQPE